MENRNINLEVLEQNIGQIDGLPSNPREWTREDLDKLKDSITETPELLEARGLIVYPYNGKFVVVGGNMRLSALQELGHKTAPCLILPQDTTIDKMKEIVIKDNGKFGKNDWDKLSSEWDDLPLSDWGIPVWEAEPQEEIPSDLDREGMEQQDYTVKIKFPDDDSLNRFMDSYQDELKSLYGCTMSVNGGNV